ncbi:Flotillin-2 [Taenia crassiceps]|uniref:Flotillin-2 n=1 Tax=Taenia crassiceps TaxID=6207 RepID=A0ABR4QGD1_9CEST
MGNAETSRPDEALALSALHRDRDGFARLVREVPTTRRSSDGIECLDSLSRGQIGMVKRDAEIGVAEAERDAGIQETKFEKQLIGIRCDVDKVIADSQLHFANPQTQCEQEVLEAKSSVEGIRLVGTAKNAVLGALSTAKADGISEMAEAFKRFVDASGLASMLIVK